MPFAVNFYRWQKSFYTLSNRVKRSRKSFNFNPTSISSASFIVLTLAIPILIYLTLELKSNQPSLLPDSLKLSDIRQETVSQKDQLSSSNQYVDPCSITSPQLTIHFDPSSRSSSEFHNPVASDVDPPALNRVFTAFFKKYLFQPESDIIVNVNATGRGRPTDIRDGLVLAQSALRRFYNDSSIVVFDYALGYSHLDRVRGSRYIFHLKSFNQTITERRDVAVIQRTFDGKCFISVKNYEQKIFKDPVYMLVPYSKRPKRLTWFLRQFTVLLNRGSNVILVLAVCNENEEDMAMVKKLVSNTLHPEKVQIVNVPGDKTGFFSRAISIRDGSRVIPKDSIMFIADVDMYIFPPMFESCRYNSIQGSQIYVPVFYSLFAKGFRIDKDSGYWRDSSHGMSCMYKSDFDEVNAYKDAENSFLGWGGEDVALTEAFVNRSDYEVFRAVEPALRHKWHMKRCEKFIPAYEDCLSISFKQLGSMSSVGRYLLKHNIDAQALYSRYADQDDDVKHSLFHSSVADGDEKPQDSENMRMKKRLKILQQAYERRKARLRKHRFKR